MTRPKTPADWVGLIARVATLIAGLALLTASTVQLIGSDPQVNTVALIAGAILVPLPLVIDRLERFSLKGTSLEFHFTQQIAELGAPKSAGIFEESGLGRELEAYSFVYTELTDPELLDTRKDLLDRLVQRASALAVSRKFDAAEVRQLFAAGSPVMRVLALGLMEGDPSLLDPAVLRSGLTDSRTGNEQYHALKLAHRNWCRLPATLRTELGKSIAADPYINGDSSDRKVLADQIANLRC